MHRIIRMFMFGVAVFLWTGVSAMAQASVDIVTYDYAPFYSAEPIPGKGLSGQGQGYVVDIVKAAYKAVGLDINVVFQPMERSVTTLKEGRCVASIASKVVLYQDISPEHLDSLNISHFSIKLHYFMSHFQGKVPDTTALSALQGYTIGDLIGNPLTEAYEKTGATLDLTSSNDANLKKLVHGRIDFWGTVSLTAFFMVEQTFPEKLHDFASLDAMTFLEDSVDLNFLKDHPEYATRKAQFQKGFHIIRENGTYLNILESYFGQGTVPEYVFVEDLRQTKRLERRSP